MANWQIGTNMPGTGSSTFYGMNTPEYGGATAADRTATVQRLAAAGVKWVRLNVLWLYMQPDAGFAGTLNSGATAVYDDYINKIRAAGMEALLISSNPAAWAQGGNTYEADAAKFASYISLLAAHYKGQVLGHQIFNEVDIHWTSASAYANVLSQAYPSIKAADPDAHVVMSGLTYNLSSTANYLQSLYSLGVGPYFDIMAPHLYPQPGHESVFGPYIDSLRTVMSNNGDTSDMWVTEIGRPTHSSGATQQQVIDFANLYVPIIRTKNYVKRMSWYEIIDHSPQNLTDPESNFGVYYYDGLPKPVRDVLPLL